jgi:hypothetical protein
MAWKRVLFPTAGLWRPKVLPFLRFLFFSTIFRSTAAITKKDSFFLFQQQASRSHLNKA